MNRFFILALLSIALLAGSCSSGSSSGKHQAVPGDADTAGSYPSDTTKKNSSSFSTHDTGHKPLADSLKP